MPGPKLCYCSLSILVGTSFFSAEQDENGDGARELKNMKSDRMKVLQLDVCSDQEVTQAVDFVKRTLKKPEEGTWGSLYFRHSWLFAVLTESFLQSRLCTGWVVPSLHHQKRVNKPGGL